MKEQNNAAITAPLFVLIFFAKNTACPESVSYTYLPLESVEMRSKKDPWGQ
jgi:hypothetical protein